MENCESPNQEKNKVHLNEPICRSSISGVSKMRILEGHRIVALTIVRATI